MKRLLILLLFPLMLVSQETYLVNENFNGFTPGNFIIETEYGDWPGTYSLEDYPFEWRIETQQNIFYVDSLVNFDGSAYFLGGHSVLGNAGIYYDPDPTAYFTLPTINTTIFEQVTISFESLTQLSGLGGLEVEAYIEVEISNNQQDWYSVYYESDDDGDGNYNDTSIYTDNPLIDITEFQGEEIYIRFKCSGKGFWAIDNLQVIGYGYGGNNSSNSSSTNLIGDLNCDNIVDGLDAEIMQSLIFQIQDVNELAEEYPCLNSNVTGLTPDQLQEMIDMMENQMSVNYTLGSGGGCDILYPDGYGGKPITWNLNHEGEYSVPENKILYITHLNQFSGDFMIDGKIIASDNFTSPSITCPIIVNTGEVISNTGSNNSTFSGFLVDGNVEPITYELNSENQFIVPENKLLYITNAYTTDAPIYINNLNTNTINYETVLIETNYNTTNTSSNWISPRLQSPIVLDSDYIIHTSGSLATLNGYLVDEDYFSSAGSGYNSNGGDGSMSVSTFGDTLTLNGESIIVPGISYSNIVPEFGSVTDIDGNIYETVSYGGVEWMRENLKVETFNDGTPIDYDCIGDDMINNLPGWCYYDSDDSYAQDYGKLYNGYVIYSDKNVCPVGWHVSNANDWDLLTDLFLINGLGTNGVGSWATGDASPLIFSQTNESYLSLQLAGANNTNGTGYEMGMSTEFWLEDNYWGGNYYASISETTPGGTPGFHSVYLGTGGVSIYKYCRCVKD